ncbi:MotE family protein [Desulfonatronum lacustre]|uniref:MotE family protein n=1 Tax=Desulfonatronum lacustre TaxID=66849 RepID=UPI00048E1781|nr:hypothetical protein [Desulfonatronum lacustre]SMP42265.1 Flagellar motility protein MotE, a chaperone for MotC folding [Desulfonatronum zhilinae]
MKWQPFGINIKISNLLAAVAVLSLCKLIFLAVWSGTDVSDHPGSVVAEAVLATTKPAHAQEGPAAEIPGAWDVAQADAPGQNAGAPRQMAAQGDLSEEWQNLRRRQEEVQRQEQTLRALENELDAKLNRLQALESRIQGMLEEADVLKDRKMKHLVDVYSNMKPREAAKALEALEEPVAVKILSGMRGRNAGEVLSFVDAEKAARLTEALTRMQLPLQ